VKALFISFPASDYAASKEFYEDVIGLAIDRESDGGPHRFTNYDLGGLSLKLFEWTEKWHGSGHSGLFIETGQLDEVIERVRSNGGKAFGVIVQSWGRRSCTVRDPFGNLFELIDANMKGDA